jgi:hypothetical protein
VNPKEQHIIDELKKGATPLPDDGYFAQLKSDVFAKIGPAPAKVVPLYRKWWALTSAAASVLLIVTFFLRGGETDPSVHARPDWNSVSREEVLAYIHENIDDFEAEAIASHLDSLPDWNAKLQVASADTLALANAEPSVNKNKYDQLFDNIDKEDILQYLDEEAIDIDDELLIGS